METTKQLGLNLKRVDAGVDDGNEEVSVGPSRFSLLEID